MTWTREEKLFWVTTYLETKSFKIVWPNRLELQNTTTASLQMGETSLASSLDMTLNNLIVRLYSNGGYLENAEYPFIAMAPRFTLACNDSTWEDLMLDRTKLNYLK